MSNYIFHPKIGEGGMATVFMAEHRLLGNKVAVKVLNKEFVGDDFIRSRFISEAKKLATMRHPHIVQVTDLIDTPEMTAYVMEFIEGQTLGSLIREKGRLNDQEVGRIMAELLSALSYVHAKGFIHRDIKPDNVLLTRSHSVKLGDFGIAKDINSQSADKTGTGVTSGWGTPRYMAPEQVTNMKEVTVRSDLYSTGVVLWEMVSGQKAYNYPSYEIPSKVVAEPLPLTHTRWDGVIQIATAKNPDGRFQNAQAFLSAIDHPENFQAQTFQHDKSTPNPTSGSIEMKASKTASGNNRFVLFSFIILSLLMMAGAIYFIAPIIKSWLGQSTNEEVINDIADPIEMTDGDGNKYQVVKLGNQIWTTSNLRTTRYANGEPIQQLFKNYQWIDAFQGGYCYYDNDYSLSMRYGNLYNWRAVSDPRGLCPKGWKIPSEMDYIELDRFLYAQGLNSGVVKGFDFWNSPNLVAQNHGGLNILPGGKRWFNSGKFRFAGDGAYFWTSTPHNNNQAKYRSYTFDRTGGSIGEYYINDGFSCRCIYDRKSAETEQSNINQETSSPQAVLTDNNDPIGSQNAYLTATASSTMQGVSGFDYEAQNVLDGNLKTWWSPKNGLDAQNWIQIDFGKSTKITGFNIHGGSHYPDFRNYGDLFGQNLRLREGQIFFDDGTFEYFNLDDFDGIQKIMLSNPKYSSYIRIQPTGFYSSTRWDDLCISEISPILE